MPRRRHLTVAFISALALAGCAEAATSGTQPGAEPAAQWREPAAYTYTLDSRCGERALIGRYRITVVNGAVAKAEGLDQGAKTAIATVRSDFVPTIGGLLKELADARSQGADQAVLVSDPADGHPLKITIDPLKDAIDDEACYTITEYAPS